MSLLPKQSTVTIANNASLSSAVCLGDAILCGIQMPAAWTAASLTFQASDDGVTYSDLYDDAGNEVTLSPTTPAGKRLAVSPDPFGGVCWLKVRSGTSGVPVAQGAARTIGLVARKFFPVR